MRTLRQLRGKYLMVVIAMCGLIASSMGIMTNVAGIFFTPIAEELGTDTASVNLTLTISNMAFAVAGIFSAKWIKPKNFRIAVIVFTLVFAGATALLSVCRSLAALYILNALRGFASGMIGSVLVTSVIGYWFLADTGFISSIALGCSGLAGALFNPLLEAVIQSAGWRAAYLAAAGAIMLLNLPAMVTPISYRPEDSGVEPVRNRTEEKAAAPVPPEPEKGKASAGILLAAMIAPALASMVCATPQLFKPLAVSYGLGETGVIMMSIVLIVNTAGKFLFGLMTDRMGVRLAILLYGAAIDIGILLLLLVRTSGAMLFGAGLMGLCYSIPTVGAVMICRELFSPEQYGRVFPKVNLSISAANALGYPVLGFIYDRTGKYDGALMLVFSLIILSVACVFLVYRLKNRLSTQ